MQAVRVEHWPKSAGEYRISQGGLIFCCPCGCDEVAHIPFSEDGWQWDENIESPTITPSIHKLSGCKWHGFLTNGVFRTV